MEHGNQLFKINFFMSDYTVDHSFQALNLLDMLAEFGGLLGLLIVVFELMAELINEKVIKAKFIRSLFYVKKPSSMLPKFRVNFEESYLHRKLGNYSIVKIRFYNCIRKKPDKD